MEQHEIKIAADKRASINSMTAFMCHLRSLDSSKKLVFCHTSSRQTEVTYADFTVKVDSLAHKLLTSGVKAGHRVIIPFDSEEITVVTFFAVLRIGAVPFSVKPRYVAGASFDAFVGELAARYNPDFVFEASAFQRGKLSSLLKSDDKRFKGPVVTDLFSDQAAANGYAEGSDKDAPKILDEIYCKDGSGETLAFVQFSSGSTSFPKGVSISYGNLFKQLEMIIRHDGRTPNDVGATWLPLYHDMGLIGGLLSNMYAGNTIHIFAPLSFIKDPLRFLAYLGQIKADLWCMPDFGFAYILRKLQNPGPKGVPNMDLSSLRRILCGSEPIVSENLRQFEKTLGAFGLPANAVMPCYGLAEAVLEVTCTKVGRGFKVAFLDREKGQAYSARPTDEHINVTEVVSVGSIVGDFSIRIELEDLQGNKREAVDGEVGEILVKGGSLAQGYFESHQPFTDGAGYYHTKDLGFMLGGELYICGRIGDRIKIRGQSFYAHDFEHVANHVGGVKFGRSAALQISAEKVVVLVEPTSISALRDARRIKQSVQSQVAEKMGVSLREEDVLVVAPSKIKKTSSGKLMRRAMEEDYRGGAISEAKVIDFVMDKVRLAFLVATFQIKNLIKGK